MSGIAGRLLGVSANGQFFTCEVNATFNCTADMLPASSVLSGRFKEFIPGYLTWVITVDQQLMLGSAQDAKSMLQVMLSGLPIFIEFKTRTGVSPETKISGNAYPQNISLAGPAQGAATSQISFQGTGPFTTTFDEYDLLIDAMPPEEDWPTIVNTNII